MALHVTSIVEPSEAELRLRYGEAIVPRGIRNQPPPVQALWRRDWYRARAACTTLDVSAWLKGRNDDRGTAPPGTARPIQRPVVPAPRRRGQR
jgi:hypothetical protein